MWLSNLEILKHIRDEIDWTITDIQSVFFSANKIVRKNKYNSSERDFEAGKYHNKARIGLI